MKVLLLAPSKSIHTHKWALYYKENGIQVKVVTFSDHYSEENAKEVDTEILPKKLPGKLSYFASVPSLRKIIREFKPTVVHAHYVSSYGLVGALTGFQPFFLSVWGRDIFQFPQKSTLNKKMVQFTLNKSEMVFSTSHVMAYETNLYTNKSVFVTPFGVDLTRFKPMSEIKSSDMKIIGTVKALSDKYGIGDLIRAFAIVKEKSTEQLKLLIVGDGPQKEEYEKLVKDLGISDCTTFTGKIPNTEVPSYINKMHIFAVPSTENSESFGVAAVESMACGVPVVVSDVGGLPEVVRNGVTGYVVPKESPNQLAEKFLFLLENELVRQEMGHNGIKHVKENYDWKENASDMLNLYNQFFSKELKS
jgi:glycosyltransferase involved in cell wall biosynthesis